MTTFLLSSVHSLHCTGILLLLFFILFTFPVPLPLPWLSMAHSVICDHILWPVTSLHECASFLFSLFACPVQLNHHTGGAGLLPFTPFLSPAELYHCTLWIWSSSSLLCSIAYGYNVCNIGVFFPLWLASLIQHAFKVHLYCGTDQNFSSFYLQITFHYIAIPHFIHPYISWWIFVSTFWL